jgi:hypothetical protein
VKGERMPTKKKDENKSAEFLLAEFDALHKRVITLEQVKANRINFFMILTSAVVAGGASLSDKLSAYPYTSLLVAGVTFLLAVIGLVTLDYSLNDSVTMVFFLRAAGRVRRYFVDKDKDLTPYIAFEPNDDRPRVRAEGFSFRGSERILLIINCVSASICIAAILAQLFPWFIYLSAGVALMPLIWLFQQIYIKKKLKNAQRNTDAVVRFKTL